MHTPSLDLRSIRRSAGRALARVAGVCAQAGCCRCGRGCPAEHVH